MSAVLRPGALPAASFPLRLRWLGTSALVVATGSWLATAGNLALWRELRSLGVFDRASGVVFALAMVVMLTAAFSLLGSLFAWARVLKPALALMVVTSALASYFMLSYHVVIDPTMMLNVVQTDPREVHDLLCSRLLVTVLVLAGPPLWAIARWPAPTARWPRQALRNVGLFLASLVMALGVGLASFQTLAGVVRHHKPLRYLVNPFNTLYSLGRVAKPARAAATGPVRPIGEDARLGASYVASSRPPLLVLVLGETARSDNFALNGYARDTTPELAALNVASFRNAWSCGTSTAASVPCMFASLGRVAFNKREGESENLLDVARRAGLAVLWVDNQSGCKGVCDRVASVSTAIAPASATCPGGDCLDEAMLQGLDAQIAALPSEARARGVLVVLHQMGSHGPAYAQRSPTQFKRFTPECTSNSLMDCNRNDIVNAYDNSIAYTDHFLAATIRWLKARRDRSDTAMMYVSDHGESLGENNLYLHGLPYAMAPDVQKHVPWITWLSPEFEARRRVATACLKTRADEKVSHDNYFHSVLGLMDVQTAVYRAELDAYAPCAASP